MKKIYLFIVFIATIIVAGCEVQWNKFEYDFDDMNWYFFTDNTYSIAWNKLEWLGYKMMGNEVIKTYSQNIKSWFAWSLIITKKMTDKSLNDFVEENLQLVWLEWFREEKEKTTNFQCNNKKIPTNIVNSRLKNNSNTIYFSQVFFEKDWYIYIISFANEDKDERNNFSDAVKYITCN